MKKALYEIRAARPEEVSLLPDIEREAMALFAGWSEMLELDMLAAVNSVETFGRAREQERLLVAADRQGSVIGFVLLIEIDGLAHLEEIDVDPAHARQGVGSALLEAACALANEQGYEAITLSTFRDVPWNGPFYRRHGFEILDPSMLTPGLFMVVESEKIKGLRIDLRVIMKRSLR